MVKPTCMPNTRKAASKVQSVLIGFTMSAAWTAGASAASAVVKNQSDVTFMIIRTAATPSILPAISNPP